MAQCVAFPEPALSSLDILQVSATVSQLLVDEVFGTEDCLWILMDIRNSVLKQCFEHR
jgi:hypothetical protein